MLMDLPECNIQAIAQENDPRDSLNAVVMSQLCWHPDSVTKVSRIRRENAQVKHKSHQPSIDTIDPICFWIQLEHGLRVTHKPVLRRFI